jgi:hypothetical protein
MAKHGIRNQETDEVIYASGSLYEDHLSSHSSDDIGFCDSDNLPLTPP